MARRGRPALEVKKSKFERFRVTEEESRELTDICKEFGIEKSTMIRKALRKYLLEEKNIELWVN